MCWVLDFFNINFVDMELSKFSVYVHMFFI